VDATRNTSHNNVLPFAVLVIGLAQGVLVALAFLRILDPGWTTFGLVGVLAGLGMAALGLIALGLPWRRHVLRRVAWLAVVAGLAVAGIWASLFGGTFYTSDLLRIAVVVASDCSFAIALGGATRLTDEHSALPGLSAVATVISVRALTEAALVSWILIQTDSGPGLNVPVLMLALSVLGGWVVLAIYEVVVGAQLLRARRPNGATLPAPP